MELSKHHLSIFNEWASCEVGTGFSFVSLAKRTQRPQDEFDQAVRDLSSIGFLKYERGLSNDDGEFYGSGYVLTDLGRTMLDGGVA